MSLYLILRIFSIVLTIALVALIPTTTHAWKYFIYSFGLSHYVLAIYYARHRIVQVLSRPHSRVPAAALLSAGASLYFFRFPLSFFFAPHQVYEEAYLPAKFVPSEKRAALAPLLSSASLLFFSVYFFSLRNYASIQGVPPLVPLAGMAISSIFFLYYLGRLSPLFSLKERLHFSGPAILNLLVAALSLAVPIVFLQVVCYHFIFWALNSIPSILRNKSSADVRADLLKYSLSTVAIFGLSYFLSPVGGSPLRFSDALFTKLFMMLSYLHITLSFALSDAQPAWITRWFKPAPLTNARLHTQNDPGVDESRLALPITKDLR